MSVYTKLLVVISLTLTLSHVGVHSARVRRSKPQTLTAKQKSDIVTNHNELRASEGSSDMEMMRWSESLAAAAAADEMGRQCKWEPGLPPRRRGHNLFSMIGGKSGKTNLVDIIQQWYDEKTYYNYGTSQCPGICARYTQIVWAKSRQVGCAYHICNRVGNSGLRNVKFLVCNYQPAGNVYGEKPFKKGPPCSECGGGAGWCKDRLCNSRCSKAGKDCTCAAVCYNCATLNLTTCRCSCADGWHGPDCLQPCEDRYHYCYDPAIISGCQHHGGWVRRDCPLRCLQCRDDPHAKAGKCPPVYSPFAAKLANLVKLYRIDDDNDGSQHQQQRTTLLSYVILSLTFTCNDLLYYTPWAI